LALVLQVLRKIDDSLVEKLRKKLRLGFRGLGFSTHAFGRELGGG